MDWPTSLYKKDRFVLFLGFTEKHLSKDFVKNRHWEYIGLGVEYKKIIPKK